MFSETTNEQYAILPTSSTVDPRDHAVKTSSGKHAPRYRYEVDPDAMTWGDNMLQVEFQLLMDIASEVEGDDPALAPNPDDSPDVAEKKKQALKVKRAERIRSLRDLKAGFNAMVDYLDRVATIYCDGVRVTARNVPDERVKEVVSAISKAKADRGSPKN